MPQQTSQSQKSHIQNIPCPKHPTPHIFHIAKISPPEHIHPEHPTSSTSPKTYSHHLTSPISQICNNPPPKYPTSQKSQSQTFHIAYPKRPHLKHSTSRTSHASHILNIPQNKYSTSKTFYTQLYKHPKKPLLLLFDQSSVTQISPIVSSSF